MYIMKSVCTQQNLFVSFYCMCRFNGGMIKTFGPHATRREATHARTLASSLGFMAASVLSAVNRTQALGRQLEGVSLSQQFPQTDIGRQLEAAAKVISARGVRGAERDAFFVSIGGFDTHDEMNAQLSVLLAEIDGALAAFTAEMKASNA